CLDTQSRTRITLDTGTAIDDSGQADLEVDTAAILKMFGRDTCFTVARADSIIKTLKFKPVVVNDSSYSLKIWIENGKIKHNLKLPPPITKTVTKTGPIIKLPPKDCESTTGYKWIIGCLLFIIIILGGTLILKTLKT